MTKRYFVPCCFDVYWNAPTLNWRNFLLDVLMFLGNHFTTFCILKGHLQSHCYSMLIGWCYRMHPIRVEQQHDYCPQNHKIQSRMLVASKAAFLENYLAFSTWILNGSSIECHEKKHQPFSLSGVRFGSRAIQISGWKSAWHWRGWKYAFHPWILIICSKSQCKTHQITQIHHFEPQKFCNKQTG